MGLLVIAEQMLDGRAGCGQASARGGRLRRDEREAFEQRFVAVGELSGGGQRLGAWEEQRDAILSRRCGGQQPQSAGEPAGRARGRARSRILTGCAQDGDGGNVAVTCGVLDVVRSRGDRRTVRGQGLRGALVGAQAPTAGR